MVFRMTGLLTVVLIFLVGSVEATLIDSFNEGGQFLYVWQGDTTSSSQVAPGLGNTIGGYRDVTLEWISGGPNFINVFTGSDGVFSFTQGTAEGKAIITWDGADSPQSLSYSLGANLVSGGQSGFLFGISDITGSGLGIKMTVYTDAANVSEYSDTWLSGIGSSTVFVPYSSFSQTGTAGPVNFSDVGATVLELDGTGRSGSDITISYITTAPEPSTLILLAMSGLGLLVYACGRKHGA